MVKKDEITANPLICSAEHWEQLAEYEERMAAWNRERGLYQHAAGSSPRECRVRLFRKCARTLRLEAQTGESHCMCHEVSDKDCPDKGKEINKKNR